MQKNAPLDEVKAEVARLLSKERVRRGISMNRLAEKSGLSQAFVSSFETTPWNPTLDSLLRIARALDVNLGDVLKQAIRNTEGQKKA